MPEELEEEAEKNIASLFSRPHSSSSAPSEIDRPASRADAGPPTSSSSSPITVSETSILEGMPSSEIQSTTAEVNLLPTTEELVAICHAFVAQLRNGTAPWVVQKLNSAYGPEPDDIASFSFWMAQVLPIEEHERSKLLVIRSPRARLRLVVYWIEQLNSNW